MSRNPQPGADERRIQHLLRNQGVGPDAVAIPPKPTARPRDWLDELLDSNKPTEQPGPPAQKPPEPTPKPSTSKPKKRPKKKRRPPATNTPRAAVDSTPHDPRQSLLDAYDRIPRRIRWLIYHGTAAAVGYRIGWVNFSTDTTAWIARHGLTHPQALFWYGFTLGCALLYRHFSPTYFVFGWACTIPIASVVVGALLYGTGYQP